jgi:ABC-type amino acid transport substrate-binding protein
VTALVNGDLDIIMSGMTHNPERAEKVWFTIPYYAYYHHLLVSAKETRSMEDVLNSGGYISCQLGATADAWAEKLIQKGYNFKKLALDSYALAFQAVLDGRAIGVISDSAFTGPYLKNNPDKAAKLKELGKIGGVETYSVATRPEDNWLRNQINYALKDLMDSPKWDELKAKWSVL